MNTEKNKKLLLASIILPVLVLLFAYIGGYAAQLLQNYQIWTSAGGTPGDGSAPLLPSASFVSCIKALTIFPYSMYGIFLYVGAGLVLFLIIIRLDFCNKGTYDKERNLTYSNKGTYGTSGFMTDEEMHNILELVPNIAHNRGVILGKLHGKAVCLPEHTRMNRNVAVFGASGSMKSRAYARNVVFQCVKRGESLIITDPKSELYADLCLYLQNNGYLVRVFNLINPENSDSWNCLAEVEGQEILSQLFCDVIIKNTGSAKGDHFWDNAEMNLLKALVLYVDRGFPPEGRNIGQVYKLLTLCTEKELNSLFDMLPISHPAKAPYNIFKQASDTVRSGVIIGLGTRLQVFQNKLIRQITSYDEINLTQPGKEKCAYFCITSDQDSTFDFLSSLFMSFVFIKLVRYADRYGEDGRLPVPVHILADELANGGCTIADLTKKISTIRSRDLSISCIFQNLPQMQNRYPQNQWQEIIGNCDTQLFLGCTDELTAKFISDRAGTASVAVSSKSKQLHTLRVTDFTPGFRETHSIGKRQLMTPDEVLRLPLDQALIILRGQKILKVEKYDFTLHPESGKLQKCRASEHVPDWQQNPSSEEPDNACLANLKSKGRYSRESAKSTWEPQSSEPSTQSQSFQPEPEYKIVMTDKQSIMS
ncbi:MAG: type IV secretory system conjugative DNA transfer family protein [Lachnospiraceae bacterium]|nr:type IV secretory system conjugative DNA transfer family protein [Lachnospiraceae bacterium]